MLARTRLDMRLDMRRDKRFASRFVCGPPGGQRAVKTSETFGRRKLRDQGSTRRPFNVGLLIPTSGTLGMLGPAAYACARLARNAWNDVGGNAGREITMTLVDSSETAADLDDEVAALIAEGGIDALVMLSNTAVCRRLSSVVSARVPLIYTPLFEGDGLPTWVHAIGETPQRQLRPALAWLIERYRARRWYLLGQDYSWPRSTHRQARRWLAQLGAEVAAERYVDFGERQFAPVIEEIAASGADAVLISLVGADSVHMCRAFGAAGLAGKILRLSTCIEENAVLGMGSSNTDGLFLTSSYFAALDDERNGAFKERYRSQFGERSPVLNSLSQSVYEGMAHLQHQACPAQRTSLPGVRSDTRLPFNAEQDPIFLGQVDGLGIRVIRTLTDLPG